VHDGASDDGHSRGGELGAGLGLGGRSRAVGLGRSRLHFGEFSQSLDRGEHEPRLPQRSSASMARSTPRVTVSHHVPASATRAGERSSGSWATVGRVWSIEAGGHPLVTTASLMTTARHRAVHRAVGLPSNWRAVTHCRRVIMRILRNVDVSMTLEISANAS
jgi:hypothetical protein